MAFRSAATTVVARLFRLLNAQGFTVGRFDSSPVTVPNTESAIVMASPVSDAKGFLGWRPNSMGQMTVILAAAAVDDNPYTAITLDADNAGNSVARITAFSGTKLGEIEVSSLPTNVSTIQMNADNVNVNGLPVQGSTAWANLPAPVAGWTAAGGAETPMFKTCDGRVYLRGRIENTSGVAKPLFSEIINPMPVAIRPLQGRAPIGVTNTGFLNRSPRCLLISPAGLLQLDALQTLAGDSIILDNTTWELD